MQTIAYTTIDKATWGEGPWQSEPDKLQYPDPATGLPCLIVRNHSGALCGYVGVPRGHPAYGQHYDALELAVHGGLTFADTCQPDAKEHGVCHVPDPGEPDDVFWLGFDCSHSGDLCPAIDAALHGRMVGKEYTEYQRILRNVYRDLAYVQDQIASLAAQLHALASPAV